MKGFSLISIISSGNLIENKIVLARTNHIRCSIARREHHVVLNIHGGLDVKRNGSHRAIIHTNIKAAAIERGSILRKVKLTEFSIYGKDEMIQRSERPGNVSVFAERVKAR